MDNVNNNVNNNVRDINGNYNKVFNNRTNQSNIDKSKKYTLNVENMVLAWANPFNPEAVLYKRNSNINDRPMLEHYFKLFQVKEQNGYYIEEYNITESIEFYVYVVEKRHKHDFAAINLIDKFGTKMASHVIIKDYDLTPYLNKVIKFTGYIYRYNEEKETKYGVKIHCDSKVEIVNGKQHTLGVSPWEMITEDNPNVIIKIEEIISKFNKFDIDIQLYLLDKVEEILNVISFNMFNAPNLIYPIILTNFLLRDDIYDEKVIIYNQYHLNIISTIIVDYILGIKPNTFDELMKIVMYVIWNYLGYDLEKPGDKTKFNEFTKFMGISEDNAKTYLRNSKRNVGGIQSVLNYIPNKYKTKPGDIHEIATIQFCKRLLLELDI